MTRPIVRPDRLCPDIPGELADAVMGLLERDPDRRTADAHTVHAQLEGILRAHGLTVCSEDLGDFMRSRFRAHHDRRLEHEEAVLEAAWPKASNPQPMALSEIPTKPMTRRLVPPARRRAAFWWRQIVLAALLGILAGTGAALLDEVVGGRAGPERAEPGQHVGPKRDQVEKTSFGPADQAAAWLPGDLDRR